MRPVRILIASFALGASVFGAAQSVATLKFDPPSFTPGQSSVGTVYLSAPAPAGGLAITLTSSNGSMSVPKSMTVAAGETSVGFTLTSTMNAFGNSVIAATGGGTTRKTYVTTGDAPFLWYERASLTSAASQGNGDSGEPGHMTAGDSRKISGDGRFVVFTSAATNLVANDKNRVTDVFIRDRQQGTTVRVSSLAGADATGRSYEPSISGDGNFVAFVSEANNLVAGDTNGMPDVFIWERATQQITLVSRTKTGNSNDASYEPSISKDGRFVAFSSYASNLVPNDTNGWSDIYIFDRTKLSIRRVSVGASSWAIVEPDGDCGNPSISANGRYVAFESFATNLVGDDTNNCDDVFVRDLSLNMTTRASIGLDGMEMDGFSFSPSISADGKVVAFSTFSNLPDPFSYAGPAAKVLVRDLGKGVTEVASAYPYGDSLEPSISADGRFVGYIIGVNPNLGMQQAGIYDRIYRRTTNVTPGPVWDISLSSDGHFATMTSSSRGAVPDDTNGKDDVFVVDAMGQSPVSITFPRIDQSGYIGEILAGESANLTVNVLQPAAAPLPVYFSSDSTSVTYPKSISIPSGAMKGTFTVTTDVSTPEGYISLGATAASRTTGAMLKVVSSQLSLDAKVVKPGATITAKFRLAQAQPSKVILYVATPYGTTAPTTLGITAGSKAKSFTIGIPTDMQPGFYYVTVYGNGFFANSTFEVVSP